MTLPEKIKLTKAGESIRLHVASCAPATVGQYPEIEFTGKATDGRLVLVPVPRQSCDRQLARIPLEYQDCIGATLTISRDMNAKDATKPYWGITLDAHGNGKPVEQSKAAEPAKTPEPPSDNTPHPADREAGKKDTPSPREVYLTITRDTLTHIVPLYVDAKIPVSMEAVAAIVATRFIAATRNGY